jgi:ABC-2 type transport system permease protein
MKDVRRVSEGNQTLLATWFITQRDLLDFWREKMLIVMFVLMPVIIMGMFGYMYPSVPKGNVAVGNIPSAFPNLRLALVRDDYSSVADTFAAAFTDIAQSQKLFRVLTYGNYPAARQAIVRGDLSGIVRIPEGFGSAILSGMQGSVELTVDETDSQVAAVVQSEVSAIVGIVSARMSTSIVNGMTIGRANPTFVIQPVSVSGAPLISGSASRFEFLAPGFMALTVVMGTLLGVGATIAKEKEQGTMDGLMACPISMTAVIVGKTFAQTIRGLIQALLVLGISMVLFGVRVNGNPSVMLLGLMLGVMSFVGVGIIVASIAPDQETAQTMMMLLLIPMMFLCGVMFPVSQLPDWMQLIGKSLPLYYAADALRRVMVLNAGFDVIGRDLTILIVYAIVTMGIAVITFRKTMAR